MLPKSQRVIIYSVLFLAILFCYGVSGYAAHQIHFYLGNRAKPREKIVAVPTVIIKLTDPETAPKISDSDFKLIIDDLKLNVPVIANVDGNNEEAYLKSLENGVAHFVHTALPGKTGNIVIFGHSSYYANKPGNYKTVFKSLNRLSTGDQLEIHYQNRQYLYSIVEKKIVLPSDVQILQQTPDQQLTLVTCWPIGSTAKRLVIVAKRSN